MAHRPDAAAKFSALRDNYLRGLLAEFLVAAALGRTERLRKAWDNYDVITGSGIRVEVKASGYLQSWPQAKPSSLNFGRVIGRSWDENTNQFGVEPEVRADVFVFAVQTCKDHAAYDALDVNHWEFARAGPDDAHARNTERRTRQRHLGARLRRDGVTGDQAPVPTPTRLHTSAGRAVGVGDRG